MSRFMIPPPDTVQPISELFLQLRSDASELSLTLNVVQNQSAMKITPIAKDVQPLFKTEVATDLMTSGLLHSIQLPIQRY